jgi:hypothetical protein
MIHGKSRNRASAGAFLRGAERRAKVAEWLSRNARIVGRTAAGMPVIALPAMAAAQVDGRFVPLESLEGVASAQALADGGYRITLTNGAQLTLSAADVQVVGGAVQVSAEAAAAIAQVTAAGGASGLGALAGLGAAGAAAAAGGGGSDGGGSGGGGSDGGGSGGAPGAGSAGGRDTGGADAGGGEPAAPVTVLNRADALGGGVSSASSGFTAPDGASEVVVTFGDDPREFQAVLGDAGAWTLSLDPADLRDLPQGTVAVTATARDAGGADLGAGTALFDIDTVPPETPSVDLANDTGAADDDGVTSDATLALSPVPAGATREVIVNGESQGATYTPPTQPGAYTVVVIDTDAAGNSARAELGFDLIPLLSRQSVLDDGSTGYAPPAGTEELVVTFGGPGGGATEYVAELGDDGAWRLPLTPAERDALPQGETTITFSARDAGGDEIASQTQAILIDTVPPAPPTVSLANDTGDATDALTSDPALTISDPPAGAVREVRVNGELQDGGYVPPTEDGPYTVSVRNVDPAGNASAEATVTFTLDTTPPAVPVIGINDTGAADDANVTADADLTLSAPAAGVTRVVTLNGADQGASYTAPTGDGTYTVTVTDTDAAGNPATATLSFTRDTVAPDAPTAVLTNDTGPAAGVTSDARLDISAVPAGATREVTVNGEARGAAYTPPTEDGDYTVVIRDTDLAGNASEASVAFTLDTTPPAVPTIALADDTGVAADDLLTGDASLTLSPTANGVARSITVNGTDQGGSYTPPGADGTYTVTVTDTDGAGNAATAALGFTLDTAAPAAPSVALANDTGRDDAANVTADPSLAFSPVPPGATREILLNGDAQGADYVPPAQDGAYTVTVRDIDAAGNVSPDATVAFTLDTEPPTVVLDAISGGSLDLLDAQGDLAITGTVPGTGADADVVVTFDGQDYAGTTAADGSFAVTVPQAALQAIVDRPGDVATVAVSATATDLAGNVSAPTVTTVPGDFSGPSITIDPVAGDDVVNAAEAGGMLAIGGATSNVPGGRPVTLSVNGVDVAGVTVQPGGAWSAMIDATDAAFGLTADGASVTVTADVDDGAGLAAPPATRAVTTDLAPPTLTVATPLAGDGTVNIAEREAGFAVEGTTDAGDGQTVTLDIGATQLAGTVQGGAFSIPVDSATLGGLTDGGTVDVDLSVTDLSGNETTARATLTSDYTAPATPAIALANDTGAAADDGVTRDATLTLAPPGAGTTRSVTVNGADQGATYAPPGADGTYDVVVTDTDAAGNAATAGLTFTLDTTPPPTPTIALTTDSGADAGDLLTNDASLALSDPPAGIARSVTVNGVDQGAAYVPPTADGTYAVVVTDTDAAGNAATAALTFTLDATAPAVAVTAPADGDVLNLADRSSGGTIDGTTDAPDGATVTVTVRDAGGTQVIGPLAGSVSGGAFSVAVAPAEVAALADGETFTIAATIQDAAGNTGASAAIDVSTDFTAPGLALAPLPVGAVLDAREQAAPLTVSGTSPETGATVTVALGAETAQGTVAGDGTWSATFSPAQLATLPDASSLTLSAEIADAAGNATDLALGLDTDFSPIVTLDPVARNGAFDLGDARDNGLDMSGQGFGLAPGALVDVSVSGQSAAGDPLADSFTAPIGLDGTWSGNVAAGFFDRFATASEITIEVADQGGAAPPARETLPGVVEPDFFLVQTDRQGDLVTFGVVESPSGDQGPGTGAGITVAFDPAQASYVAGSASGSFGFLLPNETNAGSGEVILGLIDASAEPVPGQPFITFQMRAADADTGFAVRGTDESGDFAVVASGSGGADPVDGLPAQITFVHGNGGDDVIDLSGAGPKVIVFDPDPGANGFDTVRDFSTADAADGLADAILLQPGDPAALRGDGTAIEAVAAGEALGADTGFAVFTTELPSTDAADIEAAVEGLTGEQAGDTFYVLAADGTDTVLAQVTFSGVDDASVARMALFEGAGDAAALGNEVIFPDASGVYNT